MMNAIENGSKTVMVVKELIEVAGNNADTKEAANSLGRSARTIAVAIENCLLPLAAVNYGIKRAKDYFSNDFRSDIEEKLKEVPDDKIVEPKPSIIAPAMQNLGYSIEEPVLKEMYLTLIKSAMDGREPGKAHPAYVEIIKQLTSFEGALLRDVLMGPGLPIVQIRRVPANVKGFVILRNHVLQISEVNSGNIVDVKTVGAAVDNWIRMGLIDVNYSEHLTDLTRYDWVEGCPQYVEQVSMNQGLGELEIQKGILRVTEFGKAFALAAL